MQLGIPNSNLFKNKFVVINIIPHEISALLRNELHYD
jgi:hypothetical protein